ncbi:MAG: MgtC/SapB family protein [Pseudomonadota bacterium]|uniref:MgtC/SapB family protein n=1 Tax=Thermithiobacillus tepidarius TaxID=929 RepID=UPI0004047A81|nr:MgtC/SapB family protein [Thermithiobacillus tepidarius]
MPDLALFDFLPAWVFPFLVALAIGLLIGLEREASPHPANERPIGVRTFPLITVLGFVSAYWFPLPVFLTTLALFGFLLLGSYLLANFGKPSLGLTTEYSALAAFLLGGLTAFGYLLAAMIIAVIVTLLLASKEPLHGFIARNIGREELAAIIRFALVALVVFPLLPDQNYTALQFNPRKIWLMVVLVSGLSFLGYFGAKLLGARKGVLISALFGGLVSSTAVTMSFARLSKSNPQFSAGLASGIILASAMMFLRQAAVAWAINPRMGQVLALFVLPAALLGALFFWRTQHQVQESADVPLRNPFELTQALSFAAIYAITLAAAQLALDYYGQAGVYALSLASGIADVDAITLSMADLSINGRLVLGVAVGGALLAGLSNTLVKAGLGVGLGDRRLRPYLLWGMGSMALSAGAGVLLLALWY